MPLPLATYSTLSINCDVFHEWQQSVSNYRNMKSSHLPVKFYFTILIILVTFRWPVVDAELNLSDKFTKLRCNNSKVCLTSTRPCSRSLKVKSEVDCVSECSVRKYQPEFCVGVNYRQQTYVCDVFCSDANITNSSNFTKVDPGCQYIQVSLLQSMHVHRWPFNRGRP